MKIFSYILIMFVLVMSSATVSVAQDMIVDDSTTVMFIPDRPGLGDSPFLVPPKHFQFEGSYNFNGYKGFYSIARYSIIPKWEIRAIYTNLFNEVGDIKVITLGSKIKISDQNGNVPYMTAVVYLDKNLYNNHQDENIGTHGFTYRAVFSTQHTFFNDKFSFGGNLGMKYYFNDADIKNAKVYTLHFVWSAMGLYFIDKWTLTAEAYNQHYSFKGSGSLENPPTKFNYDFGLAYLICDNFQIDISAMHEDVWFGAISIAFMIPKN